ncbi:hypothetical protein FACS1894137_08630 [Spirochaetia bacterium]|nr:hypothetical protein FACS1894137_08630 [Spirochaetia bacterium]
MKASGICIVLLACILTIGRVFAEDAIVPFDQKLALNLLGKYSLGMFQQGSTDYKTDISWDLGFGIRYKNLAAEAYFPISSNKVSFDAALNFYRKKMYYEAFFKRYKNYFNGKDGADGHEDAGLDVLNGGIMAGWVQNYENHSLRSVFSLSEKQTRSSGSFLYGFGVFYTSVYAENEAMSRYTERQHIVYFGPSAGFSYTWMLPRGMFINGAFKGGVNMGIHMNATDILLVIPQINPKFTFGRHGRSWSINATAGVNATLLVWDKDTYDISSPLTVTLSTG